MNFLLIGDEQYLLQKELKKIILQNDSDDNSLNTTFINADDKNFSISRLVEEANILPFFQDKRTVIIKNCNFLNNKTLSDKDFDQLHRLLKQDIKTTDLIFYVDHTCDRRKKSYKLLVKTCQLIEKNKLAPNDFSLYVRKKIKSENLDISPNAVKLLIEYLPNDLYNFHQEINKLVLYQGHISTDVVKALISTPLDDNNFSLTDAVINQNRQLAMKKLADLQQLNVEPILLVALLSSLFRFLFDVKYLKNKGYLDKEIARELKCHPYRITLANKQLKFVSLNKLLKIISSLAMMDQNLKNGKYENKDLSFQIFILELMR